ncbi:hypothetical protein BpHYR1_034506, partial [Brachionus plicatilis]
DLKNSGNKNLYKKPRVSIIVGLDNREFTNFINKLYKTSDIYRTVGDKSDSDEEVLSSIKQKLTTYSRIYH